MRALSAPIVAILLASCQSPRPVDDTLDALESELAEGQSANATDPAILAALAEPLMVDRSLAGSANIDMVRPPAQPYAAAIPHPAVAAGRLAPARADTAPPSATGNAARGAVTIDALAATLGPAAARCAAAGLNHSAIWATRLPDAVPLYPDARIAEAAGRDGPGCTLRAVNFFADAPAGAMAGWYRERASGFALRETVDGTTRILVGTRAGAAFALYATSRGDGGSDIDLVYSAS